MVYKCGISTLFTHAFYIATKLAIVLNCFLYMVVASTRVSLMLHPLSSIALCNSRRFCHFLLCLSLPGVYNTYLMQLWCVFVLLLDTSCRNVGASTCDNFWFVLLLTINSRPLTGCINLYGQWLRLPQVEQVMNGMNDTKNPQPRSD